MAELKSTSILGNLSVTNKIYMGGKLVSLDHTHPYVATSGGTMTGALTLNAAVALQLNTLKLPKSTGSSEYTTGSAGQVLKTNGTTIYWGNDNDENTWRGVQDNLTSTATDQSLSANQGRVLNEKFTTSLYEANLNWGGKNFEASYGCIDAAMISALGANRLAFMPAAGVTVEYSTNGGSTWSTYSASDEAKINLFNGNGTALYIGSSSATKIDKSKYMVRITIETSTAQVYTVLNKFAILVSTSGSSGCYCTIDARTQTNYTAGTDTWVNFANKVPVSGWSGWNIINTTGITTYGNQVSHYRQVRFTFGVTSHASSVTYPGLNVIRILGFGGVGWISPSTMASTGHMYTYDYLKNMTVPAGLTITNLITQGSPSSDSSITQMNRFASDLFIAGNGSAPNYPKVPGFYLGRSTSDENRHLDIVAGDNTSGHSYAYIDFNKASRNSTSSSADFDARFIVDVDSGSTSFEWGTSTALTSKIFNVKGTIQENGTSLASKYVGLTGDQTITGNKTFSGSTYMNGTLYGPQVGSNPRNQYGALFYFFNADASKTSAYNFGLYQWQDMFQFTTRTSADNQYKSTAFEIYGDTGQVKFTKRPVLDIDNAHTDVKNFVTAAIDGGTLNLYF